MKCKKITDRIIAAFIVVSLLFSFAVPVFAAENKQADTPPAELITGTYGNLSYADSDEVQVPTIVIPGMSFSDFYLMDDDGNYVLDADGNAMHSGLTIVDKPSLLSKVKKLIWPFIKTIFTQKDAGLSDGIYELVRELFKYEDKNPDGSPKYNIELKMYNCPMSEMTQEEIDFHLKFMPIQSYINIYGAENLYVYNYYMFGDVIDQADGLVDYIEMVKEQRNADKVNIVTMSMGTTILTAFLDNQRADLSSINRLISIVPIYDGNEFVPDVLNENYVEDQEFFYTDYLPIAIRGLTSLIPASALGSSITGEGLGYLANIIVKLLPKTVYSNILKNLGKAFADSIQYASQMWTLVESESYPALAEKYLSADECAPLREKTNAFYQAQLHVKENLQRAHDEYGVGVYNIVCYGLDFSVNTFSLFSAVKSSATTNSDCLIPLSSSSLGAVYSTKGIQLPADYLSGLPTQKYVSPDKEIDASTCLFPETTWFFDNQSHWVFGNDVAVNTVWLIMAGVIDDINSDPEYYPQFNACRDTYAITPKYMAKAKAILENPEGYDAKAIEHLRNAYENMKKIYQTTDLKYASAQADAAAACNAMLNALADLGIGQKPTAAYTTPLDIILKYTSKILNKIFVAKGIFD